MSAHVVSGQGAPAPVTRLALGRITYGTFANAISVVITIASQVVLTPMFLASWGPAVYGEWLTLSAAVAAMALLDLGMQTFVVNRLTQCHVKGELGEYTRVLHSGLFMSVGVAVCGAVIVIPILLNAPLHRWFQITQTTASAASLVSVLLTLQVLASIPYGLMTGIYRSIGEYPRSQMIQNVRLLATAVLTVVVLVAGGTLAVLAAVHLAIVAVVVVYVLADLAKRHPEIEIGWAHATRSQALSFLLPSSLFLAIQLAGAMTVQGSTLMAGAFFGATSVAAFVSIRTLSNVIRQFTNALLYALSPEINALEAQEQFGMLRTLHVFTTKILLFTSVCSAVFLHFIGADLIRLWTRGQIEFDSALMNALLLLLVSQAYWLTSSYILGSTNNHSTVASCTIASGVAGLGLGALFAPWFGLPGLAYGLFAADLIICGCFLPLAACRLIRQRPELYIKETLLRSVACTAMVYVCTYQVLRFVPAGPALPRILLTAATVGVFGLISGYLVALCEPERARVFEIAATVLRAVPSRTQANL